MCHAQIFHGSHGHFNWINIWMLHFYTKRHKSNREPVLKLNTKFNETQMHGFNGGFYQFIIFASIGPYEYTFIYVKYKGIVSFNH